MHPPFSRDLATERRRRLLDEAEKIRRTRRVRTPPSRSSWIVAALYVGLVTTVGAVIVAYVDRATFDTLADHVRAGYPTYTRARIDKATTTYLVYLSGVAASGVVGWLWALHAVKAHKRWARAAATAMFALGASVALSDLLIRDTSGDTGLSPLLGWVGVMPCLPGLFAVTLLRLRP